jgi:GT2 family glycosyltransferase
MLSFLRARSQRSPPPRSPLRDLQWDGVTLTLLLDGALVGARVALDLDGCFFADAIVAADGGAAFVFPFSPHAGASASILVRDRRDGDPLIDGPRRIRFGQPGITAIDAGEASAARARDLGDIGGFVAFGTDCAAHDVAIVVPVYDAPAEVERCTESVLAHTTGRAQLILIDDASPNPAIAPLLERYASRANVRVLRNERNRGFTATANRGIREAGNADVVLLNADTEVGANWLTGLRRAAVSGEDIATVTAVSDNAGAFSVQEIEQVNAIPAPWTFAQVARALWQCAGRAYPELATGNGFCMYIRRAAIEAVDMLDEAAFPQGYGEENDFCQRASARGLRHLIAGNVYVRHARSASFGHERREALGRAGMSVLRERWPNYEADIAANLHSFERRVLDWRVRRVFADAGEKSPRLRVLGSAPAATAPASDVWQLRTRGDRVELIREGNVVAAHDTRREGARADPRSLDIALWHWLQAYAIEAVLVDDAMPASLPDLAAALGVPLAHAVRGEAIQAALSRALIAARSFAEPTR